MLNYGNVWTCITNLSDPISLTSGIVEEFVGASCTVAKDMVPLGKMNRMPSWAQAWEARDSERVKDGP
jgi:hypothetical protein